MYNHDFHLRANQKNNTILDNQKEMNNTKKIISTKPTRIITIASTKEYVKKRTMKTYNTLKRVKDHMEQIIVYR